MSDEELLRHVHFKHRGGEGGGGGRGRGAGTDVGVDELEAAGDGETAAADEAAATGATQARPPQPRPEWAQTARTLHRRRAVGDRTSSRLPGEEDEDAAEMEKYRRNPALYMYRAVEAHHDWHMKHASRQLARLNKLREQWKKERRPFYDPSLDYDGMHPQPNAPYRRPGAGRGAVAAKEGAAAAAGGEEGAARAVSDGAGGGVVDVEEFDEAAALAAVTGDERGATDDRSDGAKGAQPFESLATAPAGTRSTDDAGASGRVRRDGGEAARVVEEAADDALLGEMMMK